MDERWGGFCTPNDWTNERIWIYLILVDRERDKNVLRVDDNPVILGLDQRSEDPRRSLNSDWLHNRMETGTFRVCYSYRPGESGY